MPSIGQGSGVYFQPKDKTGGNENLNETLILGNETLGENIILSPLDLFKMETGSKIESPLNNFGAKTTLELLSLTGSNNTRAVIGVFGNNSFGIFDLNNSKSFFVAGDSTTPTTFNVNTGKSFSISNSNDSKQNISFDSNTNISTTFEFKTKGNLKENIITSLSFEEKAGTIFVNTLVNTWQTVIVTGATANSTLQISMQNTSASGQTAGVRKVGSLIDRKMTAKGMANFVTVVTNANAEIEIYSGDLTAVQFRLWGEFPTTP